MSETELTVEVLPPLPHGLVDISNEDYHAGPGISNSHLSAAAGSMLKYWDAYINPERERREPTADMILGTATHSAILEPELFPNAFVVTPADAPKRPTSAQLRAKNPSNQTLLDIDWWNDFDRANAGRTVLDAKDYALCLAMRDAVHHHPVAGPLLRNGRAEQAYYATDDETGELIKCKPDWLTDNGLMIDVKTTGDASPNGFGKSAANFRYYVQAPWYLDILERLYGEAPKHFVFVAVEKTRPHDIGVYFVDEAQLAMGRARYRTDLNRIAECKRTGLYPGHTTQIEPLRLPKWLNIQD